MGSLRLAGAFAFLFIFATSVAAQQQPVDSEPPADEPSADDADEAPDRGAIPVAEPAEPFVGAFSLRGLAGRLDAIQSRAEQVRARVDLLKEAVLRGGKSASAVITHRNKMGNQFRITQLTFTVDGIRVFSQRDDTGSLHEKKEIDILSGPISPGNHTISVQINYRGHGYGPFKYLNKQTFTVKGSQTFKAVAGKAISVDVLGYERKDVPLEERPAVSFKVSSPE